MDSHAAMREIEKGNILPVYLCYGQELFLREQFIAFLTARLVQPEDESFAISKYDMSEVSVETVLEDAQTLPFIVSKKVIIAHNAVFFTGAKESGKAAHDLDLLHNYLASPVDYSVLLFIVDADKLDERKKVVKSLKQRNALVTFPSLRADQLMEWVHQQAREKRFSFVEGAAEKLIMNTGENLQNLASELEKISMYIGEGGKVGAEQVEELVARNTEQNVFLLIDEIVNKRLEKALSILDDLIKHKEEPIKILILLARQFRIILQIKEGKARGENEWQLASQIGAQPFVLKLAAEQGKRYSTEQLYQIISQLAELDYKMKSGGIDKVLGLEMFLLKLAI